MLNQASRLCQGLALLRPGHLAAPHNKLLQKLLAGIYSCAEQRQEDALSSLFSNNHPTTCSWSGDQRAFATQAPRQEVIPAQLMEELRKLGSWVRSLKLVVPPRHCLYSCSV